MTTMHVTARSMNLRSEPGVRPGTIIATLSFGKPVELLGDAALAGWKEVAAGVNGSRVAGFASGRLLRAAASPAREALIAEALAQWERFDRGRGMEDVLPFYRYVGEMWRALGITRDGRDPTPWSGAFVSFVVRRAGGYDDFAFNALHAVYIHEAITRRLAGRDWPFWGFRLAEHRPQLGDIICRNRPRGRVTFDFAQSSADFLSHCDVVAGLTETRVVTIGGNVGQSVSESRYRLDATGHLDDEGGRLFAVLRNNR